MERRVFRVCFKDGNEKLLGAETMVAVLRYVLSTTDYSDADIIKIEGV